MAALLECNDEVLLVVRARDPAQGKLDLPGGFVDVGESAEAALLRELREELGFEPNCDPAYLGSLPNRYTYRGMTYGTVDAFFRIELLSRPELKPADDVADVIWVSRKAIPYSDVAFSSIRQALTRW